MHRQAALSYQQPLFRYRAFIRRESTASRSQPKPFKGKYRPPPPPQLSESDFRRLQYDSSKIIKRVASTPPYDHKYTPSLRGLETRLSAAVNRSSKSISNDKVAYDAGQQFGEETEAGSLSNFPPGTFIETRRNDIAAHGVVLGEELRDRRKRLIVLTSSGEVWNPIPDDVSFSIQNFVPSDLVARCGVDELVSDPQRINARVRVLKKLREIDWVTERKLNIVTQKCADLYDKISSPNPEEWSQTTSTEVARLVDRDTPLVTRLAVHKFMMAKSLYYEAHHSYQSTRIFRVRPKSHVNLVKTIQDWSRHRENPIQGFAQKARKIIAENRKLRDLSRNDPPSYTTAAHSWTGDERMILTFLTYSLRRTRSTQSDPYSLGQSFILKQIDMNRPNRISDHDVHMTLMDLGVLAPWLDPTPMDPSLDIHLEHEATSTRAKRREAVVADGLAAIMSRTTKTQLGPEDFHPTDPLESIRHDFGDLPVYVIDDASAQELDDGVSIERIPSEPTSFWAHIHIADPASLIHPEHFLAKEASKRLESLYFIHRSYSLFPRSLMKHPTYGLSLGSRTDGPTNVLTFSCKVDLLGELKDFQVRAGLIRNIRIVTYDSVDKALGRPVTPNVYPFGRMEKSEPLSPSLTETQIEDLRDLQKIADRVVAKRQRDGVIIFDRPIANIRSVLPSPPEIYSAVLEPTTFRGFPQYEYGFVDTHLSDAGARNMVAEMMKLACRVASRFCKAHGVPVLRRVSEYEVIGDGDIEALTSMRTPNNYIPVGTSVPGLEISPSSSYSLEPGAHDGLGVPDGEGYSRVTSPLRRYLDLTSHWQIYHALLGSAAPTSHPYFNEAQLSELAIAVQASEKLLKTLYRNNTRYWQLMLLSRWVDGMTHTQRKNNKLLKQLEAVTVSVPALDEETHKFQAEVLIPILGLSSVTLEGLDSPIIAIGTRIPVEIAEIRFGTRPKLSVIRR